MDKWKEALLKNRHKKTHKLTFESKKLIVFLYKNNISIKDISDYLQITPCNIHRFINETEEKRFTINDLIDHYIKIKSDIFFDPNAGKKLEGDGEDES